jgi:hypothetical protein
MLSLVCSPNVPKETFLSLDSQGPQTQTDQNKTQIIAGRPHYSNRKSWWAALYPLQENASQFKAEATVWINIKCSIITRDLKN